MRAPGGTGAAAASAQADAVIPKQSQLRAWTIVAAAIALVGLVTSVVISALVIRYVDHLRQQDARDTARTVVSRLQQSRQENTGLLIALGAQVAEHPGMVNEDIRRWAASTRLFARHPDLIGIGYTVLVPANSIAGFAATVPRLNRDRRAFAIVPPGLRPAYCLIRAGTGRSGAPRLPPGFDFCAGRASILATRDTGRADIVPLMQPGAPSLFSISIPVYEEGPPETVQQRRRRFVGWVGLSLDPRIVLRRATAGEAVVGATVRYGAPGDARTLIVLGKQTGTVFRAKLADGLVLSAYVRPADHGIRGHALGLGILVYGILLSLTVPGLILRLARRHAEALEAASAVTEQLDFLAHHDPLTRLANRTLMLEGLEAALAQGRREASNVGVVAVDLDGFKEVNDTLGHAAGDRVLEVVAERLLAATRSRDTVARVGGDEFVVVLDELPSESYLETIAERVRAAISQPIAIEHLGAPAHVTASVGIAHGPAESADRLLRQADDALYVAKLRGKDRYVVAPA